MLYLNGLLLGVALASDAFSVALADGLLQKTLTKKELFLIALTFAILQGAMSLIGYFVVDKLLGAFKIIERLIPIIAVILSVYLGVKTILESKKQKSFDVQKLTPLTVFMQGIATSIDALSVGFTLVKYSVVQAVLVSLIIGVVTLILCSIGVYAGKKFSGAFTEKASLVSGIILIIIGIEILLKNIIF